MLKSDTKVACLSPNDGSSITDEASCTAAGCCYSDATSDPYVPWCFKKGINKHDEMTLHTVCGTFWFQL